MSTKQEHQSIIAATLAYSAEVHKGSALSTALQAAKQTAIGWGLSHAMARYITRDIADVLHVAPLPENEEDTRHPTNGYARGG